jgi:hypothetical protein
MRSAATAHLGLAGARTRNGEAPARLPVRGATRGRQEIGIDFSGSTNGMGTTVAVRVPHSDSTVTVRPSAL